MTFLKANRNKLFPGIKDFNSNHNKFKSRTFSEHANIMDYLWFCPGVYTSIQYFPIILTTILYILLLISGIHHIAKALITMAYMIYMYRKYTNLKKMVDNTNLYEMYIKN